MYTRQIFGTTLDAARQRVVTKNKNEFLRGNKKAACSQAAFAKRRRRKGNLSGKAMHDAVRACTQTHGLKKSQFLEEG
jgi:hypothetical protein